MHQTTWLFTALIKSASRKSSYLPTWTDVTCLLQFRQWTDLPLAMMGIRSFRCLLSSTLYVFDQVQVQKRLLFAMWLRA